MTATAQAQPNIALVKYWGKRDPVLNLPAAGSLSLTLDALWTQTRVSFRPELGGDELLLDGKADARALARVSACLDKLRLQAGTNCRAQVQTRNNFPTAAGLASSASGFAALVFAAACALGLPIDRRSLSVLARQGSGSAARSLFGGIVAMHVGERADGLDAFAEPVLAPADWPLELVVAVTDAEPKATSSSDGMAHSAETSPYYRPWVDSVAADLDQARAAVRARDFAALAEVSEHSCLKMHSVMMSSRPALMYWSGATMDCMQRIRELRQQQGRQVFFTVDAGPQVKAVCLPGDADAVAAALALVPGVQSVLRSGLGEGARRLPDGAAC